MRTDERITAIAPTRKWPVQSTASPACLDVRGWLAGDWTIRASCRWLGIVAAGQGA